MRQKEQKLIVTFHTTAEAIACEKLCNREKIAGRMIPVPRELSAGCGIAWCASPEDRKILENAFIREKLETEELVELWY